MAADDVFSAKGVKRLCRQIAARLRCRVPKPEPNAEHGAGLAKEEQRNEPAPTWRRIRDSTCPAGQAASG